MSPVSNRTATAACLDLDAADSALQLRIANVLSKCLKSKDDLKKMKDCRAHFGTNQEVNKANVHMCEGNCSDIPHYMVT